MKYFVVITFSIFVLLFGGISCYANFFSNNNKSATNAFVSRHNFSKIEMQHNLTVVLEESNLEIEEEFSCNNDLKNTLLKNPSLIDCSFSKINCDFAALFDLNIFNNYFKNFPQIIIGHNPLYLAQSVFLI